MVCVFLHEAEILAKASNCFRTEATALLDSFFLVALLKDEAFVGLRGLKVRSVLAAGVAIGVDIVTTGFKGVNFKGATVLGDRGGDRTGLLTGLGDCLDVGDSGCGDEQLNMSSPYFAIRSARLKSGFAGAAATDLSDGGELSDDDDNSESLDSLSVLLRRVRLVLDAGVVAGLLDGELLFLNKWYSCARYVETENLSGSSQSTMSSGSRRAGMPSSFSASWKA